MSYYAASGGLGTDQYPPFTLGPAPDYPATLDIAYPTGLSRGLVLVKWWLLAIPHYLIIGLFVSNWWGWSSAGDRFAFGPVGSGGLFGLLVIITAVVLLITGKYPPRLFALIVGGNRWIYRVIAYATLMTDQYPPFRLDQGGYEPTRHHRPCRPPGRRTRESQHQRGQPHDRATAGVDVTTVTRLPPAARPVAQEWHRLAEAAPDPGGFDPTDIGDLPEAARRWLTHAIPAGTPLSRSVQLTMQGRIRIGKWRSFTATQIIKPADGYIWAAKTHVAGLPITGYDRYSGGSGHMRWHLPKTIPMVSATGPDVTRSAAGRLASEIVVAPTAFRAANWTPGDDSDTAVASSHIGDHLQEVKRAGPPRRQPPGRHAATVGQSRRLPLRPLSVRCDRRGGSRVRTG